MIYILYKLIDFKHIVMFSLRTTLSGIHTTTCYESTSSSSGWPLEHIKRSIHIAVCKLLLICSKLQPDDDSIESKHVVVWITHKVVFYGYSFISYFIVEHNGKHSWIKIDQLMSLVLFFAQHVSNASTFIFRNLQLCVGILLWFDVCWRYGVVRLGWCGIVMQAEALVPQPA